MKIKHQRPPAGGGLRPRAEEFIEAWLDDAATAETFVRLSPGLQRFVDRHLPPERKAKLQRELKEIQHGGR